MLRKKQHLTHTNNFSKPKEASQQILTKRNDKVTVQYIQEQPQLIQKPEDDHHMIHLRTTSQDALEIEYLEENPTVEEFIEEPNEKDEFEDTFYPNAIHCLLDLYKDKYESLPLVVEADLRMTQVWQDIAKDMQESYFEFNEQQVRQKYVLLRDQYFGLNSRDDIENFDYFEQIHDIYNDLGKDNILKGLVNEEINSTYYKDEVLLNPVLMETNNDAPRDDFKSEEIVHKEHEFIDMVEKELQAMEEGIQTDKSKEEIMPNNYNENNQQTVEIEQNVKVQILEEKPIKLKRNCSADETTIDEPPKRKSKLIEYIEVKEISQPSLEKSNSIPNNEFTLFQYNEQQEKRHREKINLIEKSLKLQERAIEQQNQLLHELIKRLTS